MHIKYIECSGTPREMGHQYGEQAKHEIILSLEAPRGLQASKLIHEKPDHVAAIGNNLKRIPEIYEEIVGIAEGCGRPVADIIMLNHVDTIGEQWIQGCTPVGLISDQDGMIVAKNNDGGPQEYDPYPFIIRKSTPENGLPMLQVTYAGWLSGLDAMNAAGLANTHSSVGSVFDKSGPRIDIRLAIYHLMRSCKDVEELFHSLCEMSLTGKGFNIISGDRRGSSLTIEAAVPLIASRDRNRKFFYATNHFITDALKDADMRSPEGKKISIYRLGYLDWLDRCKPPQNLHDIKEILSSHDPWAPCRHAGAHGSRTFWSQICLPQDLKMLVSSGAPCECAYAEFGV